MAGQRRPQGHLDEMHRKGRSVAEPASGLLLSGDGDGVELPMRTWGISWGDENEITAMAA